jgi:hypothetical protein
VALFRHCCSTIAQRNFTILALVHWPSLNYKRRGWHRKQGDKKHNGKGVLNNTHHTH